jgi:hypothetical protein
MGGFHVLRDGDYDDRSRVCNGAGSSSLRRLNDEHVELLRVVEHDHVDHA